MEKNFTTAVQALFNELEGFISSKTVVGDPIHIGDTIILPLVDVSFGVGAGASGAADEKIGNKESGGGGLGAKITPSAVIVIHKGETQLINIKNQDSLNKLIDMAPGLLAKLPWMKPDKKDKKKAEEKELAEAVKKDLEDYYEETDGM
ncbi:MAG: sporulation protein [Epulopiscium sp.]|nr:sporulation protein [Candidatus Epulonipiscium sp.]